MKKESLVKNIITLIFLTIILKGVGFVNRIVIAFYFGTTSLADIFYNASGFIDSISAIILASLSVGVINIYIANKQTGRNKYFISNLIVIISLIMISMSIVFFAASDEIAYLLAPGFVQENHQQLNMMIKFMCLALPFQGLIATYSAVLQAEKKFTPVKLTGTITSLISITCVFILARRMGIQALLISYVVGIILNAIFLIFNSRKLFKFKSQKVFQDPDIKKLILLVGPLILGTAGNQLNLIIDKSVASQVALGAVSALSYSCVLYLFVENIIINSIVTAIFPDFTEKINHGDYNGLSTSAKKIIVLAESLLIPIVACLFYNSENITKIVYFRGNFDNTSLELTSAALKGYVIGLPFLAVRDIITRVYYAYGDTKCPVIINLISVGLNIFLDFFLYNKLGVMGITLATSLANAFSGVVLYWLLSKHNKYINSSELKKTFFELAIGMFLIIGCNWGVVQLLNGIPAVLVSILLSVGIQILVLFLFKIVRIEQLKAIISTMKEK